MLEELYRRRALSAGSARYYAWLFSSPTARDPLLGIFALLAEWRAASRDGIAPEVTATKLGWWREEVDRLSSGAPVHPIGCFLRALPGADRVDWRPLDRALEAAARPLAASFDPITAADSAPLEEHADALVGGPLRLAARLGTLEAPARQAAELIACTRSIALGEILSRMLARSDLEPTAAAMLRNQAIERFAAAERSLPPAERARQRGLLVLAAVEAHHLRTQRPAAAESMRLADLALAWRTARRALRAR